MILNETPLKGVYEVNSEPNRDERGYFARTFCKDVFASHGIDFDVKQANVSGNLKKGTLRGLHYQDQPKPDPKLVSCSSGAVFDVAVDLREESETCCRWFGVELTEENNTGLYIPAGFAHGFISLADDTEVHYLMGEFYDPDLARGVRWNDPAFAIDWPMEPVILNERDAAYPDWA